MRNLTVAASLALALALGAGGAVLLKRQRDLEERIARLEKQKSPSAARMAAAPAEPETAPLVRAPSPTAPPPAEAARPPAPLTTPPAEPLAPAVKDAVAREVERQLKERGGGLAVHPIRLEDPVSVMEKELGLSPAQKVRIAEIWKRRDEEVMKWVEGGPGPGGFAEHARQLQETETRYDAEIKRELDFAQQAKYDELRRQGKLHGGNVVIQLHVEDKPAEKK